MVSIFRLLTVEVKASKLHILVWLKYLYKVNNILLTYKNKKRLNCCMTRVSKDK